jgi:hypothetical protein
MSLKPLLFGSQSFRAPDKRTELGAIDRRQVGPPLARFVRLDMAGSSNAEPPQGGQIETFRVNAPNASLGVNYQHHDSPPSDG